MLYLKYCESSSLWFATKLWWNYHKIHRFFFASKWNSIIWMRINSHIIIACCDTDISMRINGFVTAAAADTVFFVIMHYSCICVWFMNIQHWFLIYGICCMSHWHLICPFWIEILIENFNHVITLSRWKLPDHHCEFQIDSSWSVYKCFIQASNELTKMK